MGQVGTRQLDTITRIYKNSSGEVIGMHCIGVVEEREMLPDPTGTIPDLDVRRRRGGKMNLSFRRFNLTPSGSRVIDKIQMIGSYDDFVLTGSSNDLASITYFGRDEEGFENDLIFSLSLLPQIGETIE